MMLGMLVSSVLAAVTIWAANPFFLAAEGERPKEGDKAPAFDLPAFGIAKALPDNKGAKTIALKDFAGKKNVILVFFPKAATRG